MPDILPINSNKKISKMSSAQIEIQIIAILVALCCSLLGVFLLLRKSALISDAISHSILPGIVLGFFWTEDLNNPLLILLAAGAGMLTVFFVEWIQNTRLVKEDTSIGIVFPALFSIGIIMITRSAGDIHLDTDAVLLGELVFAPFDRVIWNNIDLGPKSIWIMGILLLILMSLVFIFYKELKLSTFDSGLAAALGFSPVLIHYLLMFLSSVTIVASFDAVGSILVVGFMIVPASIAYLLTNRLERMMLYTLAIGILSAICGYWLAHILDASIAGSIMAVMGFLFLLSYLFSPINGRVTMMLRHKQQGLEVALLTLLIHIQSHEDLAEKNIHHLREHINWEKDKVEKVVTKALSNGLILLKDETIIITQKGIDFARSEVAFYLER